MTYGLYTRSKFCVVNRNNFNNRKVVSVCPNVGVTFAIREIPRNLLPQQPVVVNTSSAQKSPMAQEPVYHTTAVTAEYAGPMAYVIPTEAAVATAVAAPAVVSAPTPVIQHQQRSMQVRLPEKSFPGQELRVVSPDGIEVSVSRKVNSISVSGV